MCCPHLHRLLWTEGLPAGEGERAADLKDALQEVHVRSREGVAAVAAQKQRLETQLANVRMVFELGDLSKEESIERRGELIRQRDGLRETDEWEAVLARAAAVLSDLPAGWRAADGAQRNALARMLFAQIRIKDDWVAAVEPQPSFASFFQWDCQVRRPSGGSDGDRCRHRVMTKQAQTRLTLQSFHLAA
jgi:hypothetical protein